MRARLLALPLIALASVSIAQAEVYPSKIIKLVVPTQPGSPPDSMARVVVQHLQPYIGGTIVIENRQGAGHTIGSKAVATAEPDGHTLLLITNAFLFGLYPNPGYDPIKSFAPIATLTEWSHVLVIRPDFPAQTVQQLVAYAKANPGKVKFGFVSGTPPQILGETLKNVTGADFAGVPYRGAPQVLADLMGGQIDMVFWPTRAILPLINQGKARPLAYTGATRSLDLPDVPTITESGFPKLMFNPDSWVGIVAPAGTPATVVNKINGAINKTLRSPELLASFAKLGLEPRIATPQEFAAFMISQSEKWPAIIKAAGLQPE